LANRYGLLVCGAHRVGGHGCTQPMLNGRKRTGNGKGLLYFVHFVTEQRMKTKDRVDSAKWVKRAGPLVTLTAGVDGIVELRELDVQDPPPLYAPGTPALDLFHRCLLPAIRAFDAALVKAYRLASPKPGEIVFPSNEVPTVSAFNLKGAKYKVRRVKKVSA
jgi:hypothetical protein